MQIIPEIKGRPNCSRCLKGLGKCDRHNPRAGCNNEREDDHYGQDPADSR
jgi:hypothetical protein